MNNVMIKQVVIHKHLGLTLTTNLNWNEHIHQSIKKTNMLIGKIWTLNKHIPRMALEDIYLAYIRPVLEYGCTIYDNCSVALLQRLEHTQRRAALACTRAYSHTKHENLLAELGWNKLEHRRSYLKLTTMYKIVHGNAPRYLQQLLPPAPNFGYNLRNQNMIPLIRTRLVSFQQSYFPSVICDWNILDNEVKERPTANSFKRALIRRMFTNKRSRLRSHGTGTGPINHARLRMGLSGLNKHRHNYHFIDSHDCHQCNGPLENNNHYLLACPRYHQQRRRMMQHLGNVPHLDLRDINCDILLHGSRDINVNNQTIFNIVQHYIVSTKRFA